MGSQLAQSGFLVASSLSSSLPLRSFPTPSTSTSTSFSCISNHHRFHLPPFFFGTDQQHINRRFHGGIVFVGTSNKEDTLTTQEDEEGEEEEEENDGDEDNYTPDPQDLEYVSQIKRVVELLKKNRDMLFSEIKLTIMIEDPRDVERRRLLGIDDEDAPTRDELAAVLEEINEGKIPRDRVALQMLAEEIIQWPNLEVEAPKKSRPGKSLYAKATDTGVDPKEAAKRLNIDWDSAAEIEDADDSDETEVPSAVGYGALYLVTAFPVIIGISVVLILFYNSLQ